MKRLIVTSFYCALVMEGESPELRLEALNERRRKFLGYLERAELAWANNPTDENFANVENLRECVQDVQDEIDALVNEL